MAIVKALFVLVASNYAGGLRLDDAEFASRPYDAAAAYRASKQADRMLAAAWAARQPALAVYACHPGIADSSGARGLGMAFSDAQAAAKAGAATPLLLALSPPSALAPSGAYYSDGRVARCPFAEDTAGVDGLWALVESYDA